MYTKELEVAEHDLYILKRDMSKAKTVAQVNWCRHRIQELKAHIAKLKEKEDE